MANSILDDPATYKKFDRMSMLKHLHSFPDECQKAWERGLAFGLPMGYGRVQNIVILGMGGSGIGGQILRRLIMMGSKTPVWVHQDYGIPPFVDEHTLVIASSYSGNTEETIAAFAESLRTPSKKFVLTSGGRLGNLAKQEGVPAFVIDYPAPPRAALPHSFFSLAGILHNIGLLRIKMHDFAETIRLLSQLSLDIAETKATGSNPAKQLAINLQGYLPIIYGAGILTEVAQRWKTQLNENSKTFTSVDTFPELCHNAIVGWEFPERVRAQTLIVFLSSRSLLHPSILQRYDVTIEIFERIGLKCERLEAQGESPLAQIMWLTLFGDYLSYYLAMLNGVDPTPVYPIDSLKRSLGQIR